MKPTLVLVPCLLCDDAVWARHAEMAEKLGRAALCVVPECGHMSTLERPEAVSRAMSTWLETIGSLQGRPGL